jgi:hypothetical protein
MNKTEKKKIAEALLSAASKISAAHTEIPAPEGAPKPQVFKKPKKSGPDEFTIEGDKGKKITLLAEIQATLEEVARLLK